MNTRKTLAAAALSLGLVLTGASAASAQTTGSATSTGARANFFQSFVTALSQKFNLNESDVTAFLKEQFAARKADVEAKRSEAEATHLAKAVTNGKLTQAQADLITAKEAEVKAQVSALQGKTGQELKESLKAIQDSLKAWATANNIPLQYLRPAFGKSRGRGFGMGMGPHS